MTTREKSYPFFVRLKGKVPSFVIADQIKSIDWRSRKATRKGAVSKTELLEVRAKIKALIG